MHRPKLSSLFISIYSLRAFSHTLPLQSVQVFSLFGVRVLHRDSFGKDTLFGEINLVTTLLDCPRLSPRLSFRRR